MMVENLVISTQENLGFAPFEKIDPNVTKSKTDLKLSPDTNHFTQAAAISVLAGIYKYGSVTHQAGLLFTTSPAQLLHNIFADKFTDVVTVVSYYGDRNFSATEQVMIKIADETIAIIKTAVGDDAIPEKISSYIAGQRHNILVYLPPDLKLGTLINDNSIDDATNKMEGPVSGLMHFFENLFAEKK